MENQGPYFDHYSTPVESGIPKGKHCAFQLYTVKDVEEFSN